MTFSIIARDEKTGRIGIAVASKFLAGGSRNIFVKTGVGAIASQALFNPYYGPRGLALLAAGASADDAVRLLTAADEGREVRQLHIMDRKGKLAAATGSATPQWSGHLLRKSFSVAGNALAGPQVIEAAVSRRTASSADAPAASSANPRGP